jgi:hypothetical protein
MHVLWKCIIQGSREGEEGETTEVIYMKYYVKVEGKDKNFIDNVQKVIVGFLKKNDGVQYELTFGVED